MEVWFHRILYLTIILTISEPLLKAQNYVNPLNNYDYKARVGLVDEFFDRFNGAANNPVLEGNDRERNLLILFDQSLFLSQSPIRMEEAKELITSIIKDSVKIDYSDSRWFALAHCKGSLNRQPVNFDLFLKVEKRGEEMYKWVITKATGKIFSIAPKRENEMIMLYPDDHETNFMSLGRMSTEEFSEIKCFMNSSFEYDQTSVFAYLIYSGKLKIDYVDKLEFVFTQVPDYIFHINYFDRKGVNSGWLISDFYKFPQADKASFYQFINPVSIKEDDGWKDNNLGLSDSIVLRKVIQPKDLYYKRLKERYAQLQDYLAILSCDSTKLNKRYYAKKLETMFVSGARVYCMKDNKDRIEYLSINEFISDIINHIHYVDSLKYLTCPTWTERIVESQNEEKMIEADSQLLMFKNGKIIEVKSDTINERKNQTVSIYREETEDGSEWIPLFGDLYVKIKSNK